MFSKGRLTWEILIAGAVMGALGAINHHYGFLITTSLLKDNEKAVIETVKDGSRKEAYRVVNDYKAVAANPVLPLRNP